jgi:gliding motility-associated-like protein
VTDNNGCSDSTNIVVPDATGPTVTVNSSTDVTCFGANDGTASVTASGGAVPYSYFWNPSGGSSDNASNLSGGDYEILVTDNNGCLGFAYVSINEPDEIVINSTVVDEDCGEDNGGIFAFASGGAGGLTYLWSPGGQTSTSIVNIENGSYSLTVTDFDGCTATENYTIAVVYDPNNPNNPDISISPDTAIYLFEGDQEQINASGAVSYSWTPSIGLSCDDCANPVVTATTETYYTVTGFSADNCWDTSYIHIIIKVPCADMFLPTSFSPNGDGLNDELRVLGTCINFYEYSVFDKWGKRIFYMDSDFEIQYWNGKINGEPIMIGSYPYVFKAQFYDDSESEFDIEEKGILKIVR